MSKPYRYWSVSSYPIDIEEIRREQPKSLRAFLSACILIFGGLALAYWVGSHFSWEVHRKVIGVFVGALFWGAIIFMTVIVSKRR